MNFKKDDLCSENVDVLEQTLTESKTLLLKAWTTLRTGTDVSDALEDIDDYMREILAAIRGKQ